MQSFGDALKVRDSGKALTQSSGDVHASFKAVRRGQVKLLCKALDMLGGLLGFSKGESRKLYKALEMFDSLLRSEAREAFIQSSGDAPQSFEIREGGAGQAFTQSFGDIRQSFKIGGEQGELLCKALEMLDGL